MDQDLPTVPATLPRWLLGSLAVGLFALVALQLGVDPYGVWGTPVAPCCTATKVAQAATERMFKPYQVADTTPEVVFLGSSSIHMALPATWPGVADDRVYNLALDGMHVPELEGMVDFLLARSETTPETVVLVADLFWLSARARAPRPGFSVDRLDALAAGGPTAWWWRVRETVLAREAVGASLRTPVASVRAEGQPMSIRGQAQLVNPRSARAGWAWAWAVDHLRTYGGFRRSTRDLDRLVELVGRLRAAEVDVVVALAPVHPDLRLTMHLHGLDDDLADLRAALVSTGPVWDFTGGPLERSDWLDPGHVHPRLGAAMVAVLSGQAGEVTDGWPVQLVDATAARWDVDAVVERAAAEPELVAALMGADDEMTVAVGIEGWLDQAWPHPPRRP